MSVIPLMFWTEFLNLNDKRFIPYRRLRKSALDITLGPGHFVAESHKVVQALLQSNLETHSILGSTEELLKLQKEIAESSLNSDQIFCVPQDAMEGIVGMSLHQGIMAIAKRPPNCALEDLGPRVIFLNGVVNPENVGSISRSAGGFGFNSIIFDKHSSDPFVRRSVRVSMGNVFKMKTHHAKRPLQAIQELKAKGYAVLGTDFRRATATLGEFNIPEKYVLIIGSEVHGMDSELLDACDAILKIPTRIPLNASHAATIFLYEANKAKTV